jgi:hypothetical protein
VEVAQPAVKGDEDPAVCGRRGNDVRVGRAGQAFGDDSVDVVPCALKDGGG